MAQQTINVGAAPNDGTGTPLRTAFQYTNSNFSELYTAVGPSGNNIVVPGSATITGDLTVDTSTLKVDSANNRVGVGTASPHEILTVANTGGNVIQSILTSATGTGNIFFATSTAGVNSYRGYLQYDQSLNSLAFGINSTTAMTLNSTGLGVGVASPAEKVDVAGNVKSNAWIGRTNISTPTADCAIYRPADNTFAISTANTERFRVDISGNVGIGVTPSAGKGCLQLSSGINFPATQVASSDANTLDDYEEGTWTGTLGGGTTSPTTPVTATGRYTKIGRIVTLQINFANVNTTGASGNLFISGIPFTNSSVGSYGTAASYSAATFTGTLVSVIDPNDSSSLILLDVKSNAAWAIAQHNAGTGRYVNATITYTV